MPTSHVITTIKGREKLAKAHVGEDTLPIITEIGFGTEGHDPVTGKPTSPSPTDTEVGG